MKKSELRQLIKEEIKKILNENIPYRDMEMVIDNPKYLATPYSQATGGRKIDTWEKLIAVLNTFDIYAQMSDDPRALRERNSVASDIRDFLKTYSGDKNWNGLNDTGRKALDIVGIGK